jgi:5-methylcytosine-specific restriction enzyme A
VRRRTNPNQEELLSRKPAAGAEPIACELCGRHVGRVTRHHLKPRSHGGTSTALLCPPCHRQLHALFTNHTLAEQLDSLESLKADPEVQSYLAWIRKQPDRHVPVRKSRSPR